MVEISLILDTPLKSQPQEVYIGSRMISSLTQTSTINQHRLRERRKHESKPNWNQNRKRQIL